MATGTDSDGKSVVHLLHRAGQRADELFLQTARGLSPRQFEVLKAVARADGLNQTAIMVTTGIDRSSVSSLVARMVRTGLLQRRRTRRDSRTYAVRLTSKGRQALEAALPRARAADEALLALLSPGQKASLLQALERISLPGQPAAPRS